MRNLHFVAQINLSPQCFSLFMLVVFVFVARALYSRNCTFWFKVTKRICMQQQQTRHKSRSFNYCAIIVDDFIKELVPRKTVKDFNSNSLQLQVQSTTDARRTQITTDETLWMVKCEKLSDAVCSGLSSLTYLSTSNRRHKRRFSFSSFSPLA